MAFEIGYKSWQIICQKVPKAAYYLSNYYLFIFHYEGLNLISQEEEEEEWENTKQKYHAEIETLMVKYF